MEIQPLKNSDIHLLNDLQPPGWQDIMSAIQFYISAAFCFPVKVTDEKKIIGIGTTIVHGKIAWLAHIIVHPDNRNQGIGRLITQSLIDSFPAKNCETIYLIATDLGEPVYRKIGFETETEYLFFKELKADENWTVPGNIVGFKSDYKDQIASLDRQVSGEDRLCHLDQYLADGSFVYLHDNIVEGFYLPSFGEGLIIASSISAGHELMKLRLTIKENAAFPADNLSATAFMHQNNFKEFRTAKRMRLGKKRIWQPTGIYNRIGGNLG